jgi:hypothetical protein
VPLTITSISAHSRSIPDNWQKNQVLGERIGMDLKTMFTAYEKLCRIGDITADYGIVSCKM